MKTPITQTIVTFKVLSQGSIQEWPLETIVRESDIGELVMYDLDMEEQVLPDDEAIEEMYVAGSDPTFFMLVEEEE